MLNNIFLKVIKESEHYKLFCSYIEHFDNDKLLQITAQPSNHQCTIL